MKRAQPVPLHAWPLPRPWMAIAMPLRYRAGRAIAGSWMPIRRTATPLGRSRKCHAGNGFLPVRPPSGLQFP
jgi:hypothetical protein